MSPFGPRPPNGSGGPECRRSCRCRRGEGPRRGFRCTPGAPRRPTGGEGSCARSKCGARLLRRQHRWRRHHRTTTRVSLGNAWARAYQPEGCPGPDGLAIGEGRVRRRWEPEPYSAVGHGRHPVTYGNTWSWSGESNPGPPPYHGGALPTELLQRRMDDSNRAAGAPGSLWHDAGMPATVRTPRDPRAPGRRVLLGWRHAERDPERLRSACHVRGTSATLTVEIADTDAERHEGLSGRSSLPADTGMVFVWDQPVDDHLLDEGHADPALDRVRRPRTTGSSRSARWNAVRRRTRADYLRGTGALLDGDRGACRVVR